MKRRTDARPKGARQTPWRRGTRRTVRGATILARLLLLLTLVLLPRLACAVPGLLGTYYSNKTLTAPAPLTRVDSTVDFSWGAAAPDASVTADQFSVRWTGNVRVQTGGTYTFQTVSDDGVRLYVNGTLVINNWTDHAATTDTSTGISLNGGVDYAITLEYYENGGTAQVQLNWKKPGDSVFSVIPASTGPIGLSYGPQPILEYRFEETAWAGTAGEVADTSGSGYNGQAAGLSAVKPSTASSSPAVSLSPGTCRYGVFNRTNKDYVALPSSFPALGANGSFTITAWIRTTDNTATNQRIFADDESNNHGYGLSLGDPGAGKIRFFTRGASSSVNLDSASVVSSNTWYFIAATLNFSTRTKTLRIQDASGTLLSSVSSTYTESNIGNDSGVASIGGNTNAANGQNTSSYGFAGNIDEVRAYASALSASELDTVRGLAANCPYSTLLAQYHFEEAGWSGTPGELKDSAGYSGGPYNGTSQGSPKPSAISTLPARSGSVGTCGYASFPGPTTGGGDFVINGLPVSTVAGAQTSIAFWVRWDGTDQVSTVSWNNYVMGFGAGYIGFHTNNSDLYGTSSSGMTNAWHHVVAVFTNGSMTSNKLYLDGAARTLSQLFGAPLLANAKVSSSLQFGGYALATDLRFTGQMDELRVYSGAVTAAEVAVLYAETHPCSSLHHVEVNHSSGSGLTCTPSTLTVKACLDAACATPYTGGLTGTLTAAGTGMSVNWPSGAAFAIGSGSSSTTANVQVTTPGSVVLGTSALSVTPTITTTCNFGSPSCTFTAADAGLVFTVPNHAAESAQSVSVSALRKPDNGAACVPAFASTSKSVTFTCSALNPSSGTRPVRVGGKALNASNAAAAACDVSGQAVSLAYDASGVATTTVQYADVGQVRLDARYAGSGSDAGLVMTGTSTFIAAPASFAIGGVTAGPIRAGTAFGATVTALNAAGATTPNFGRETSPQGATLSFARAQPTGTGASDGAFTGSLGAFASGVATTTSLVWSEVGRGDLNAVLTGGSYLGSGLTASGTTGSAGAVGRFVPHHFDVVVTPACGAFTYAAQPFTVRVTARNGLASPGTTVNYDGSTATSPNFSQATTLVDAPALGVGSFGNTGTLAAATYRAGVATTTTAAFGFTAKLTAPQTLAVRATDADGVASTGFAEGSTALRSGRLKLANAFGSEKATLAMPVQVQYWSGNAWVANGADSCTVVPAAAVVRSAYLDSRGAATAAWTTTPSAVAIAAGNGTLTLSAPTPTTTGSLDLALNLGSTAADQSCLAAHPASTGAGLPWLRAQQGACAATWDRDPAARATFGIYSPETRKTLHVREIF